MTMKHTQSQLPSQLQLKAVSGGYAETVMATLTPM